MVFFELPFGRPKEYDKETKRQRVEKLLTSFDLIKKAQINGLLYFGIVKNIDANNLSFPTLYGKPLQIYK